MEEIHNFIIKMWNVNEIVANIRKGDNTKTFEELVLKFVQDYQDNVCSLLNRITSNYRKVIIEVQVRNYI